jgi:probable H4MPT-linked C1 transfer pathway protein
MLVKARADANIMSSVAIIGWDLGGAHLKAARLDADGRIERVVQLPCPLWQGMQHLDQTLASATTLLEAPHAKHAITMTGELADLFDGRAAGVRALVERFVGMHGAPNTWIYAGACGFVGAHAVAGRELEIASANWMASAAWVAARLTHALLVDIGSTTTDIVPISPAIATQGKSDHERLACEELVYTGLVRTPVMAVAPSVPFGGRWLGVMAEQFATMADVYRLTGQLEEDIDQMPTADGRDKSIGASATRLARMIGVDTADLTGSAARELAHALAAAQMSRLEQACRRVLSGAVLDAAAPLVGAGVGRFLVVELARRLGRPYVDFAAIVPAHGGAASWAAHCAPAVAVGGLLRAWHDPDEARHPNSQRYTTEAS